MKRKLTITVDDALIHEAECYAQSHGMSFASPNRDFAPADRGERRHLLSPPAGADASAPPNATIRATKRSPASTSADRPRPAEGRTCWNLPDAGPRGSNLDDQTALDRSREGVLLIEPFHEFKR